MLQALGERGLGDVKAMQASLLSGACTDGLSCRSLLRPGLGQSCGWFSLITASKASPIGSELGTVRFVLFARLRQ